MRAAQTRQCPRADLPPAYGMAERACRGTPLTSPSGYRGPLDPSRDHWPSQPLVDGRAYQLLERWAQYFAILVARLNQAQADAAYGPGQADLRTWQRGGD